MQPKALIVDDNRDYAEGVRENLALYGIDAATAGSIAQATSAADRYHPDVVFIDIRLGNENGIDLLKRLKPRLNSTVFVMITGYGTIDSAIESLKLGAHDYLQKPVQFESILQAISGITRKRDRAEGRCDLESTAVSTRMRSLLGRIDKIAETDLPVLITGENGTGKELVADYIVGKAQSPEAPYVKINSSAFSESLLDNELFGHEKGAYTGADTTFRGVFERADGGTLFLDEIGDMPLTIQSKILRALQNREVRRLGSETVIHVTTRVIAATNKDLEERIASGTFRQDLYYRLNAAQVALPPLRERKEDIEAIAKAILGATDPGRNGEPKQLSQEVSAFFRTHTWPGNIRELRNALLYAAALSGDAPEITMEHLPGNLVQKRDSGGALSSLEDSERRTILQTLEATSYNKSKTASLLSISRSTLYQKIKKYGIDLHE